MDDLLDCIDALALMRQHSWLSPSFPVGSYSYSHGIEWAVQAGYITNRESLVEWLEADLRFGTGRNEAIFFREAHHCTSSNNYEKLLSIAELAAAYRGTAEFQLEASQQAISCVGTMRRVWPDDVLSWFSDRIQDRGIQPTLSVVLGIRSAREDIPVRLALPVFLQSCIANLVTAGVRLVPLGQTDGQLAVAELEEAVLAGSLQAMQSHINDLGSAGFMVDLASMLHQQQYTRLFRS